MRCSADMSAAAFFTSVLASILAAFIVLWVERMRSAALKFEIERDHPLTPDGRKFLRLLIHNRPMPKPLAFFLVREPALRWCPV